MQFGILDLFAILGSLGIFIYGMKVMSEGIQNLAGDQLKNILGYMTSNRLGGVVTGFVTTSLIQSSSATTVMIVSFVNAGLLTLRQAIGVIMGANIGTTVTAVIITFFGFKFSISDYTLAIIAISLPLMFSKRNEYKSLGDFLFGFGILFMGLDLLKNSVPDLQQNPEALEWIQNVSDMGYGSVLLFIVIGTLITIVVQSSSAAMAITLIMCDQGWITFDIAAALVLGENIGTTITANIAATVGNLYAKRAARAHFIFNIFGVIWMLLLYYPFLNLVDHIMVNWFQQPSPFVAVKSVTWALTLFHILFNITNTFLLIWFVNQIEKVVVRLTPAKATAEAEEEFRLSYIGSEVMRTPEFSLIEVHKELSRFGAITRKMFTKLKDQQQSAKTKESLAFYEKIEKMEDLTDRFEEEITAYLVRLSEGRLNVDTSAKVVIIHSVTNDLERVGDSILEISKNIHRLYKKKLSLDNKQKKKLAELSDHVEEAFDIMLNNLEKGSLSIDIKEARKKEQEINKLRKKIRKSQMRVVEDPTYEVKSGILFRDIYQGLERVADQIFSVNLALAGEKFDLDEILDEDF
ncbi:Na/Pi cotransporter family protein [Mangrovivirga cuniculi]|uniref:Na/Pi cotransporter n=1 Tax=Mangrovivirga cuniculi TaxID=2715131 RepID=A0A4D7JG91_9BACT|nr:Na/Pi cotransporter family protein [Mangrovivirga cuniculi]QCK13687.1 Na/Pi cotransporter [Mangrovivirga cuniculi]